MAFYTMGIGHHGLVPNINATTEIPGGRYRLLHQVGRSQNSGHHHEKKCMMLRMEEHRLQVRYTQSSCL